MLAQPHDDNAGDWQGLDSAVQAPRYAAIAQILHTFQADSKVLDIGCGEAVLRSWLPKDVSYTGIEPSSLAERKAVARNASDRIIHTSGKFEAQRASASCS